MYDNAPETIPSEILCEIFQHLCYRPISLHVLDNSSRFDEFPWAVGQVCKHWRAIFLSCPHLWTSLFLRYHYTDIVDVDRMSRRTRLCLERSEQLPLIITVRSSSVGSIEDFPRTTWKLLLSCSERWERADVALSDEPLLFDLLKCKMPILKSLTLRADPNFGFHFIAMPRLTELDLFGWIVGCAFPWSQLTKLKISGEPAHIKTLEILSRLQNIEELRVGYVNTQDRNDDHYQCSIRLASLRLLAVQIYHPIEILTRIEAPLLEHLWVDWCPTYPKGDYLLVFTEELSSFIHRSSCHIRRLTLHDHVRELLSRLMTLLSSIEGLCIKTTVAGDVSFLVEPITRMNDGVCLPNLRELEVTCLWGRDDDEELMTAMSGLLEMRSEESRLISVTREDVPLDPGMVRMSMSFK
ncbi:hypothetical protein F5887DRAFT_1247670 [Amanita rubescens]|nr:hypothetical protein F5887DRAFT_1247670 [Amanita rubescens]